MTSIAVSSESTLVDPSNSQDAASTPATRDAPWVSTTAASPPPASFWTSKSPPPKSTSFVEIMSETLAEQLADEESAKVLREDRVEEVDEDMRRALELSKAETASVPTDETSDDLLLAQMLQLEFDKEFDAHLERHENHVNQNSKVGLSYRNFTPLHPVEKARDHLEEDEDFEEERLRQPCLRFTRGAAGKGKSKHDIETGNKRNADRVMNFPPEFETGDGDAIAMRLPNHVYNDLKVHSHKEQKISQKIRDKVDRSTAELALDSRTRLSLYKLVNAGLVSEIQGTISTGKESVVIYAKGGSAKDRVVPTECAIKVFKTSLAEFKRREEYMKGDHRLPAQGYKKQNPRKIIRLWAEREMHNLNRIRRAGLHCPEVVSLKKNVLVMSFVGSDGKAAPKLRDAQLSASQMEAAQAQIREMMKTLFSTSSLVHADLSEYNTLWHAGHVWFIDVGQSVPRTHPHALEFLYRDCVNVAKFFQKQGIPSAVTPETLFNEITDLNLEGSGPTFAARVVDVQQSEEFMGQTCGAAAKHQSLVDKELAFDYFFDKATKQRKKEKRERERRREEEEEDDESEDSEEGR